MGRKKQDSDGRRTNATDQARMTRVARAYSDESVVSRFMLYVVKQQDPPGCWDWVGSMSGAYGRFWLRGRISLAHRASYVLFVSAALPDDLMVLHSCDNKLCVNPRHLKPGTHAENMREAVERKRMRPWNSQLSTDDVRAIRTEYRRRDGELPRLAEKYNTSIGAIFGIVHGRNWKIANALPVYEPPVTVQADLFTKYKASAVSVSTKRPKGEAHHKAKMTAEKVAAMRAEAAAGARGVDLAKKYGIGKAQVSAILRGKFW